MERIKVGRQKREKRGAGLTGETKATGRKRGSEELGGCEQWRSFEKPREKSEQKS